MRVAVGEGDIGHQPGERQRDDDEGDDKSPYGSYGRWRARTG